MTLKPLCVGYVWAVNWLQQWWITIAFVTRHWLIGGKCSSALHHLFVVIWCLKINCCIDMVLVLLQLIWSWSGWLEPGSSGVPGPTLPVDVNDLAGNGFQSLVLWWRFSQSCLAAVGNKPLKVFLRHHTVPDLYRLPLLPFCEYRPIRAPPPTVHHASHWHIRHLAVPHTGRVSWHWTKVFGHAFFFVAGS